MTQGQGEGKRKLHTMNLVAAGSPLTDMVFVWVFCSKYGVSVTHSLSLTVLFPSFQTESPPIKIKYQSIIQLVIASSFFLSLFTSNTLQLKFSWDGIARKINTNIKGAQPPEMRRYMNVLMVIIAGLEDIIACKIFCKTGTAAIIAHFLLTSIIPGRLVVPPLLLGPNNNSVFFTGILSEISGLMCHSHTRFLRNRVIWLVESESHTLFCFSNIQAISVSLHI